MAGSQNDYEASPLLSLESLRIGTLLKDAEVVGWSLTYVAVARFFGGDLAEATRLSESALSLARVMQLPRVELAALDLLAYVFLASGDLDQALEFGGQGLDKSRTCGELWVRTRLLNVVSQASWRRGETSVLSGYALVLMAILVLPGHAEHLVQMGGDWGAVGSRWQAGPG